MNKREANVDEKIKEGHGLPEKSIETLVKEELNDCKTKFSRKGVPSWTLITAVEKTSWGKRTLGEYK